MASFATRSAAAGVLRAWHWDDAAKLGGQWLSYQYTGGWGISPDNYGTVWPTIDLNEGASTGGALKMAFSGPSPSNAAGTFGIRLADDSSVQVGLASELPGVTTVVDELYVQVRFKWNSTLAATRFLAASGNAQGGVKLFDTATDYPRNLGGTSSNTKCVVQTMDQTRPHAALTPHVYNYGRHPTTGDSVTRPWADDVPGVTTNCRWQNQRPDPYCQYPDWANCWEITPNVWHTLKLRQKILGRSPLASNFMDHEGDLWVQTGASSSQKLIAWNDTHSGYVPRLWGNGEGMGVIYLFPYITDKDSTQVHGECVVWYDELIISTQDILDADPPVDLLPLDGGDAVTRRSRIKIV